MTLLRQVPLGDLIAADRAAMAPPVEATGGMRTSAAERLRLAAEVYRLAAAEGEKPTKAVAEFFGISSGGASNLVARVRSAGLLPPTSPGKAIADQQTDYRQEALKRRLEAIRGWADAGLLDEARANALKRRLIQISQQ